MQQAMNKQMSPRRLSVLLAVLEMQTWWLPSSRQHCRHMAAVRSTPSLAISFYHQLCVYLVVSLLAHKCMQPPLLYYNSNIVVLLLFVNDVQLSQTSLVHSKCWPSLGRKHTTQACLCRQSTVNTCLYQALSLKKIPPLSHRYYQG